MGLFFGGSGGAGSQGTGSQGAQGFQGAVGNQGNQGAVGNQGFQGNAGTGSQGAQGFQGATGGGSQAPAGTGVVTVSSGSFQTPIPFHHFQNIVYATSGGPPYQISNAYNVRLNVTSSVIGSDGPEITLSNSAPNGARAQIVIGVLNPNNTVRVTGFETIVNNNNSQVSHAGSIYHFLRWEGIWQNVTFEVRGPQGSQGFQGNAGTGSQGAQGFQGAAGTGNQGAQGFQGNAGTGSQGAQGFQGAVGNQGFQGNAGTGSQGAQGFQGAVGNQGFQGNAGTGSQGAQGFQGAAGTGNQGAQGFQGNAGTGSQGAQGFQGAVGNQGFQGNAGTGSQGAQGFQGAVGNQGFQGNAGTGSQGAQGFQGAAGTGSQGAQGFQGADGNQGFQGSIGSGSQGFQGAAGTGSQGAQGFQGAQGAGMASHTSTSSVSLNVGSRLWVISGPSTTLAVNDFVRCNWNDGAGRVGFLEGQITTINFLSITVNCLSRTVVSGSTFGTVSNWTIRQINPAVGAEMITSGTLPLARLPGGIAASTFSNTEPITGSTAASEQARIIFRDLAPSETTSIRHRYFWSDSEGTVDEANPDVLDIKPLRGLSFASNYGLSISASEVRASWRTSLGLGGAAIANIGSGASEVSAGNHTHSIYTRRVGPGQIQHRVNATFNASGYVSGITATSTPSNFGFYQIAQTGNFLFNPAEVFGVNTTFRIRLMVRRSPGANATLRVSLRSNRVGRGEEGVPGLLDNAITGTNEVGSWVSSDISTGNGFYETYEIFYSVPSGNGGSNIQDATLWFEQV